jgi:hypothetical protein
VVTFFEVADRADGYVYAVAALTDQLDPGRSRLYRWVPNMQAWIRDDGILRDFHSFLSDRLNEFIEIAPAEAAALAANVEAVTAQWLLARYASVSERLSSADLGP